MKTKMLDYGITILEKVSFDRNLFWKEYQKFKRALTEEERLKLQQWVRDHSRKAHNRELLLLNS